MEGSDEIVDPNTGIPLGELAEESRNSSPTLETRRNRKKRKAALLNTKGWKDVEIDPNELFTPEMEGFCGLEELTEYPDDLAGFPGAHEPTGAGAAAAAAVAEVAPAGVEVAGEGDAVGVDAGAGATKHETTTDSTDTTPRKRKHSDPIASMSQADDGEVVDPAELERGAKKRKKKRKKRTMSSETASDDGRSPTLEWNGRGERVPSMFDEAEEDMLLDSVDIPVVPGADADAEEAVPEVKKKKKRKGKGKGVLKAAAAAKAKAAAEAAEAAGVSVDKATPVAAESDLVAAAVEAAPVLTAAEIGDAMPEWRSFGLPDPLMQMLHEQGFDEPTPVQAASIPQALQHRRDVLGAAATGSGKTLAFGLPILARMLEMRAAGEVETGLQALVLTPTRELAIQVHDHLTTAAKHTGIRVAAIVGGLATVKQSRLLKHKPGIVVATPGRLWELIFAGEPHFQTLNKLRFLVIDEADRMAEKGHYKELRQILDLITGGEASRAAAAAAKADAGGTVGASKTPIRQNFIFSATLFLGGGKQKKKRRGGAEEKAKGEGEDDASVQYIADLCGLADGHARIDLCGGSKKVAEGLTEARISCTKEEKDRYLYYFLHKYPGRTLVFVNSISCIRRLLAVFALLDLPVFGLHAKMQQRQRLKNLDRFKARQNCVLIASDVAARGLDITGVQHVFHYQLPREPDIYVHRSGRTARAHQVGLAIALVAPEDTSNYRRMIHTLNHGVDLPTFPVDHKAVAALQDRLTVALQIDKTESSKRKAVVKEDWFSKQAEMMDIELDEEHHGAAAAPPTSRTTDEAARSSATVSRQRSELKQLLETPIDSGQAVKLVMPASKKERARLKKASQGNDKGAALRDAKD